MKLQEVYVVNRAIDGEDICGMPPFGGGKVSGLVVEKTKKDLVEQGILKDPNAFTQEGLRMAKRMADYKNAGYHVRVGPVVFGMLEEGRAIALAYNPVYRQYSFTATNTAGMTGQLCKAYPFLRRTGEGGAQPDRFMGEEELRKEFAFPAENSVAIVLYRQNEVVCDELILRRTGSFMCTTARRANCRQKGPPPC